MKVKITAGKKEKILKCSEPVEQLIKQSTSSRWVLAFVMREEMNTDDIDEFFGSGNIEALEFEAEDSTGTKWTISGYQTLNSASIRRTSDGGTSVEVQLIKTMSGGGEYGTV